jgi:hypothetical protein
VRIRDHLSGLILLLAICSTGCDRDAGSSVPEQGATPSAATSAAGAQAASPSGAPAGGSTGAAAAQPAGTSAVVIKGEKKVEVGVTDGGTSIDLKNDAGKGSVSTSPSGTVIKGKSGKSITIPGLPAQ